ncbi:CLUMA_CG014999, isoform A [Clunio marinus]|uniref:CLUMA_CG014999, isoform A n=1 Tax=Clunio marinus TaxID=568069 RepID=A0A1J1ING8_9DIPT|nr:CLUMA_CG014999, isoform A [Clunio marinus]
MLLDRYSKFIIENSSVLMSKLPIYITDIEGEMFDDENQEKFIKPLMESERKAKKVIVELKREKIMKFLGIFKKFGDTFSYLEIRHYAFETLDQLRIILRYAQNLKVLKVTKVTFQKEENKFLNSIVQIPKLSLKQLKELDCVHTDPKIFSLFTNNDELQFKVIRLRVSGVSNYEYGDFIDMMSQQKRLQQLTFEGVTSRNCDIFRYLDFLNNGLKALVVENCLFSVLDEMRNFIQIVKNQKQLKVLKIINTSIPTSMDVMFTYRYIFSNYINEAHLDIGELSFFRSHHFHNRSIKSLTLYGNFAFENLPIFINFIRMFPNVVRLKLVGGIPIGDKYLYNILSTFRNLKELYLPGFTSRRDDSNFSNLSSLDSKLHTLVLDYIDYDVKFFGWKNIVSNLKLIKKLVIKRDYGKVSNEIVDVIVKTLKLKHLELGIGVVSEEILRNIVYNNCCDELKVLKIAKTDFEKIEIISAIFAWQL